MPETSRGSGEGAEGLRSGRLKTTTGRRDQGKVNSTGGTGKSMWQPIESAPLDRPVELSFIEKGEVHALAFPCRRNETGWASDVTMAIVDVSPTHWRDWPRTTKP